MTLIVNVVTRPHRLYWWQWGQILGWIIPILLLLLGVRDRLLWALAIHLFVDFTAQSNQTSVGKKQRTWPVLAYHAFISGGYTGLIVGGLPGVVISTAVHFLVDTTNKFGLDEPLGPILDQTAHILTIIAIWGIVCFSM